MEDRVNCFFQGKKKVLPLIYDYNGFIANFLKEFNLEKNSNNLDFFILNNQERINFDKKLFNKYFLNNKIFNVYCEYKKMNNELRLREENQVLKNQLEDINKIVQEIKEQNLILKAKYESTEERLIVLKGIFEEYKKETQNIISNLESKIINYDVNSNNLLLKSNISKYENTEDHPKPVKRKARTPIDNDDDTFEKEKPINREKTPIDNSNYFKNKNTYYQSNMGDGDNGKQNTMKISNNVQNSGSEYTTYNQDNEDNDTILGNNSNINNNQKNKNKSINSSNNNYSNNKNIHNSNNNFNKNNFESKKGRSKIETPNDRNIVKKSLSCEFIIDSRIPSKLKSSVKKSYSMSFNFKLKNNGKYPIPKNTIIKSVREDSDLIIEDKYINKGEELKPNNIIEITISANFKDKNNIKAKIYQLRFFLYNKDYGKIGKDGLIQVEILDESQNIIDISKNFNKNNNENYYLEKNEPKSYYDRGNSNSNEIEYE